MSKPTRYDLIIKYKKDWLKINMVPLLAKAFKVSNSEVKRAMDQGAVQYHIFDKDKE